MAFEDRVERCTDRGEVVALGVRARAGESVALLCYSRGLGRYFERVVATWPARERPTYVGLFHDLPRTWGAEPGTDDDGDHWERRLPLALGELAV